MFRIRVDLVLLMFSINSLIFIVSAHFLVVKNSQLK